MPERAYLYRVNAGSRRIRNTAEEANRRINSQRGFSTPRALAAILIPAITTAGSVALVREEVLPNTTSEVRESDWHGVVKPALYGAIPGLALTAVMLMVSARHRKAAPENYIFVLDGRFGFIQIIGKGGFGLVHKARYLETGQLVAVKESLVVGDADASSYSKKIIAREAEGLEHLTRNDPHPSIPKFVGLHWAPMPDGLHYYLITEFIDGIDLTKKMEGAPQSRLPLLEAFTIAVYVNRTLQYAWEKVVGGAQLKFVHRDIKPDNLRLRNYGKGQERIVVLDWGLVRGLGAEKVTKEGFAPGSYSYMAPEQLAGREVDFRADQYALGATLYEMITGRGPIDEVRLEDGRKIKRVNLAKLIDPKIVPTDIRQFRPGVIDLMCRIVMKMLSKNPMERYQSHAELERDLLEALAIAKRENL